MLFRAWGITQASRHQALTPSRYKYGSALVRCRALARGSVGARNLVSVRASVAHRVARASTRGPCASPHSGRCCHVSCRVLYIHNESARLKRIYASSQLLYSKASVGQCVPPACRLMARTSTKIGAIHGSASLLQKAQAVGVAHSRGDGRGRRTILACLVLVTARLEQKTQAVGVEKSGATLSGRSVMELLSCTVVRERVWPSPRGCGQ